MMNIMYAADDNYAEIMAVSILSVIENNRNEKLHFYIVEDSISSDNLEKLRTMIETNGAKITFIKKPDIRGKLGVELKTLRWSDSAYSRLFLKELFGENTEVGKLLYLDCDTLIVDSLRDLWDTDISDCLGAACLECMSNMHKKIIGAKKTDNYVNTGMLLLNVRKWIDEDIEALVSEFIRKYKGKTEYVDQGVINGTVSNRFKLVNPRYNLTALAYDFTYEEMQIYRKPQFGYSKEIWENAVKNPAIVHFTTSFLSIRPWYEGSRHPYAIKWKETHDRTPWADKTYRELRNREKRDSKERLYRDLPRGLAVRGAGFLHAYIKPLVYKIR
jgi:lipopolysaccharide biosynthesis glycosyltransferase